MLGMNQAYAIMLRHRVVRPDIETWAQYLLGDEIQPAGKTWSFSGTHDLGALVPRSAQAVVDHLWASSPGNRRLRVYAPYAPPAGATLTLPSAILRMALHLPHGSQSLMLGEPIWRSSVAMKLGIPSAAPRVTSEISRG
ncbi:hypothetical protein D3C76_842970 [compost metagenome]